MFYSETDMRAALIVALLFFGPPAFAELPTANGTDTSCRYDAEIESINLELEAQLA